MSEPIVDNEIEGLDMARPRRVNRAGLKRLGRRCLIVAAVLAAIPVVLTFLYLPSFVHPISTLMVKDLATFSGYDRRWVSIDDVSPVLANSVIMARPLPMPSPAHGLSASKAVPTNCIPRIGTRLPQLSLPIPSPDRGLTGSPAEIAR